MYSDAVFAAFRVLHWMAEYATTVLRAWDVVAVGRGLDFEILMSRATRDGVLVFS